MRSSQLLLVNSFSLSQVFTSASGKYSKRKKVEYQVALMIKQAMEHKMQGGYSKYSLYINTVYRNSVQFTTQKTHWMNHDPHGGVI
jgi:hypothetical protein